MTAPATRPAAASARDRLRGRRGHGDRAFRAAVFAAAGIVLLVLLGTAVFLVDQAWPALRHYGFFSFLGSDRWAPSDATRAGTHPNPYGIVQFMYGTASPR